MMRIYSSGSCVPVTPSPDETRPIHSKIGFVEVSCVYDSRERAVELKAKLRVIDGDQIGSLVTEETRSIRPTFESMEKFNSGRFRNIQKEIGREIRFRDGRTWDFVLEICKAHNLTVV